MRRQRPLTHTGLLAAFLRSQSERPFRQNFPAVGRTRDTFLDSCFLINAVCSLKHFMTFLCKEYFLQLSVAFVFDVLAKPLLSVHIDCGGYCF